MGPKIVTKGQQIIREQTKDATANPLRSLGELSRSRFSISLKLLNLMLPFYLAQRGRLEPQEIQSCNPQKNVDPHL